MLTDKASSSMGKEICRKLEPSTDIDEIRHMQIIAGTSVYKRGELCMDPVSGNLHVSSNLAEVAACIITDLIF